MSSTTTFTHFAKLKAHDHRFRLFLIRLNIFPKKDRQLRIVFKVYRKKYQTVIKKTR